MERRLEVSGEGCSNVRWTADVERGEITFFWTSFHPDVEWIGIGISPDGGMHGADIVTIKKSWTDIDVDGDDDDDVQFIIDDRYSADKSTPVRDYVQSYELLHADVDDEGRMEAVVRRKLKTCDRQDMDVESYKQYFICASGYLDDDGEIAYHGPSMRSKSTVNFLVDEDLLINRAFHLPETFDEQEVLSHGIVARSSLDTAVDFVPLDIQLTSVNLTETGTSYYCQIFYIPKDLRFAAFEQIYAKGDDGEKPVLDIPQHVHHLRLQRATELDALGSNIDSGKPFDCINGLPNVPIMSVVHGLGQTQTPPNVELTLQQGYHILEVHYENTIPVEREYPGIRIWAQPTHIKSTSIAGHIAFHNGEFDSIFIPADPEEKEVSLGFLVSAEYTQALLPDGGVQIFANFVHMHRQGVRGKVQVIRDGINILDPVDNTAYDFDTQSPNYKPWRLLPGDAMIVTCVYKAHPTRNIVGGPAAHDEMCLYVYGMTPRIPGYERTVSTLVPTGEPFMPTYITPLAGKIEGATAEFSPVPETPQYEALIDYRYNICEVVFRNTLESPNFSFAEPGAVVQMAMMVAVVFCLVMSRNHAGDNVLREARNNVVYIGQTLFSSIGLPIAIVALAHITRSRRDGSMDGYEPFTYSLVRGFCNIQSILYMSELLFRIKPSLSLIFHHLVTSTIVIFLNYAIYLGIAQIGLIFGLVLILFAFTEQPVYLVLFLKNKKYYEKHPAAWKPLCYLVILIFVGTRIIISTFAVIWTVKAFDPNLLDWKVQEISFSTWDDKSDRLSNVAFASLTSVGIALLLLSNFFVVSALLYVSKLPPTRSQSIAKIDCDEERVERTASQCSLQHSSLPDDEVSSVSTPNCTV